MAFTFYKQLDAMARNVGPVQPTCLRMVVSLSES